MSAKWITLRKEGGNPYHDESGKFAEGPGGEGVKAPKGGVEFGPQLLVGNSRMYVLPGGKTYVCRNDEEHRHLTQRVFGKTEDEMREAGGLRIGKYALRASPSTTYAEVDRSFVDAHADTLKMMGDWSSPQHPFSFEVTRPSSGFLSRKIIFTSTITEPGKIDRIIDQKPWTVKKSWTWFRKGNDMLRLFKKKQPAPQTKKWISLSKSRITYEAETALIKESAKTPEARAPHTFKSAVWTHPNGHPRCVKCGMEEPISGKCSGTGSKDETKKSDIEHNVPILKVDKERRLVWGVVLEPGDPDHTDAQHDFASAEEIEMSAHDWLRRFHTQKAEMGLQHEKKAPSVEPIESYIAPMDFKMGETDVAKGSWVLGAYVGDDSIWEQVKKGELTGYSIGGSAERGVVE